MAKNEPWDVPKIWNDEAWILGGGPSLISSFNIPSDIVEGVRARKRPLSTFTPYMEAIHNKNIIGINVAYQLGDWIDFCFLGDSNFLMHHTPYLKKFNGIAVSCADEAVEMNWIKYMKQEKVKVFGISNRVGHVSWNKNSGAAAISLAYHLGVKRIILVGFDMALSAGMQQHWHNVYRKGPRNNQEIAKSGGLPFKKHLHGFDAIKRDADAYGIEILNVSLNSQIKQFEKVPITELL